MIFQNSQQLYNLVTLRNERSSVRLINDVQDDEQGGVNFGS